MIRPLRSLLSAGLVCAVVVACSPGKRGADGRTPGEQRQIAEACLSMLRSSLTNAAEISPDDPRVPEAVRRLHPVDIRIDGTDVVITRAGSPQEYHFSRRPSDPKPWVLYVAGHGYQGHRELIRLDHQ